MLFNFLLVSALCWLKLTNGDVYCSTHGCDISKCLPDSWVCDGTKDCDDGSDEAHCGVQCNSHDFQCLTGGCVHMSWRCDGHEDCKDGSDERNCSDVHCSEGNYFCPSNNICIETSLICDGVSHCPGGFDESKRACEEKVCPPETLKCDSGHQCIPYRWICNHVRDCEDGADEFDCPATPPTRCPENEFQCLNTDCISMDYVCDSFNDCQDGSDELNCHGQGTDDATIVIHDDICSEKNGGCSQICNNVTTPGVERCECLDGYILEVDGFTCSDIDECEKVRNCSQLCQNLPGSYLCYCEDGFDKDLLDQHVCLAKDKSTYYIRSLIITILCLSTLITMVLLIAIIVKKWRSTNMKEIIFHTSSSSSSSLKDEQLTEIISTNKVSVLHPSLATEDEKCQFIERMA